MFKLAVVYSGVFGLTITLWGGQAHAQSSTSNCMSTGPNMVHCDTMNMDTTSTSSPPSDPQNNPQALAAKGIRNLIFGDPEKAFRIKVGKLLADGDCQGAARLAFETGRFEMGQSISASCQSNTQPAASPSAELAPGALEGALHKVAANAKVPMDVGQGTTIVKVEAIGSQLRLTANVSGQDAYATDQQYSNMATQICSLEPQYQILKAGASVQVVYLNASGQNVGTIDVTRRECGL
jgi:hypothetical protein